MARKTHQGRVLVSRALRKTLAAHEVETATILAVHFKCDVSFLTARNTYKAKTPDIEMGGRLWELKSPQGNSKKHTIKDQLKRGKRQSRNIVIDTKITPLDDTFIKTEILRIIDNRHARIHGLILIDKNNHLHILK